MAVRSEDQPGLGMLFRPNFDTRNARPRKDNMNSRNETLYGLALMNKFNENPAELTTAQIAWAKIFIARYAPQSDERKQ